MPDNLMPPNDKDDFSAIKADAKDTESNDLALDDINKRLEQLELKVDQSLNLKANTDEAIIQLKSYLHSCEKELNFARNTRVYVSLFLALVSMFFVALFICYFAFRQDILKSFDPSVVISFFVATVGGTVTILIALARSASRSFDERNPDVPLGIQLREILAAIKSEQK